jgi:hypothetical protein
VLCSVDVAVFIFGSNKKLYEYSSGDMRELINRYAFVCAPVPERKEREQEKATDGIANARDCSTADQTSTRDRPTSMAAVTMTTMTTKTARLRNPRAWKPT